MKKITRSFFLVACLICIPAVLWAEVTFRVTAEPDQNSVKQGMMFLVRVGVTNATESTLSLRVHDCAFDRHWETDHENVHIQSWTCEKSEVERTDLDAGGTYGKNIILYVSGVEASGPVTFRMGFKHLLESGDEMEPVWSDPVTVNVQVPEEQKKAPDDEAARDVEAGTETAPQVEVSEVMPDEAVEDGDEEDAGSVSEPGEAEEPGIVETLSLAAEPQAVDAGAPVVAEKAVESDTIRKNLVP